MSFDTTQVIGFLIVYQCLLFVVFLLFNQKSKPFFIKMLALICTVIATHFSFMVWRESIFGSATFFGPFFGLLYGPLYLHFSKSLMLKKISKPKALLHYIPALCMLLVLIFYTENLLLYIDFFSVGVTGHFVAYLGTVLVVLFRYRKKLKKTQSTYQEINLQWLEVIIYIQGAAIVIALAEGFIRSAVQSHILVIAVYILVLILLHCFYYLGIKHVELFKGFKDEDLPSKPAGEYSLEAQTYEQYLIKLKQYVAAEKPYLDFDISLSDFSRHLEISTRNLSYIINKEYSVNFYEFVNGYRLEVSKQQLLKTDKQIKEIMFDSGFSNKATFNTFFKKNTGCTPSQFRKEHKN
tara:strand:- start:38497 stop:39549 length:1053 start_codon:yes stop_codon:yes gene_type:complete